MNVVIYRVVGWGQEDACVSRTDDLETVGIAKRPGVIVLIPRTGPVRIRNATMPTVIIYGFTFPVMVSFFGETF